jgi:hypothetical protein
LQHFSWLHAASVLVCVLLILGVLARRRRRAHIPLMLGAILIDLTIVAVIEFDRDAIATAEAKMGPLMIVHIAISVLVLVLYGVQVVTGIKKVRGRSSPLHGKVMPWLLTLRLGNLVTSFLVMQ